MQPHILLQCLSACGIPAQLQLWILDFLTNRRQYVRTGSEVSNQITVNTGAPQGCVLSAFLFIIYTNSLSMNNDQCKVYKYADDTAVLGLIHNEDETFYRDTIENVCSWCDRNYLVLNASKTKEMIFDFRKNKSNIDSVTINSQDIEIAKKYKYLGVYIQDNLKWDIHVNEQIKKANKRLYHVRCLSKLKVDNTLISLFYNSVISSVLTYAISSWWNSCTQLLKDNIHNVRNKVRKIIKTQTNNAIEDPHEVYISKCTKLGNKIIADDSHPLHEHFKTLPRGKRLASLKCRTSRYLNTFVPSCVRLLNENIPTM
jgi:hypothetical protein